MIGVAAGIGYAIVTYLQWHDLRHNFTVTERAYLHAARIDWHEEPPAAVPSGDKRPGMVTTIYIDNSGHIPATHVFGVIDEPYGPTANRPMYFGGDQTKVFPGRDAFTYSFHLTKRTMPVQPDIAYTIMVNLTYDDGFGETDTDDMCFVYNLEANQWISCMGNGSIKGWEKYLKQYPTKQWTPGPPDTTAPR